MHCNVMATGADEMHDAAARGIIACRMCLLFTKEIDLMHACEMVDSNEPLSLTYTKKGN